MARAVFLKQRGPGDSYNKHTGLALDIILHTALEVAEGMAYMHARGILQCDLSRGDPPSQIIG